MLPYRNPALPTETRVEDLLARMTVEEKVGQMMQLPVHPQFDFASPEACERGEIGSILCAVGEQVRPFAEAALRSRLGIPLVVGIDAIHGHSMWEHATMYPSQLALSQAWDEKLCEDVARATAREVAYTGIHWTFSPVLCMPRDLRWGRVNESFGEDGLMITRLGLAMIKGYQGDDLTHPESIAACAKHFVGYGESEGGRDASESLHSWRTLQSVYLPPFEAAAKAGCATFMSAYHAIDGVPIAFSRKLLSDVLRKAWSYDGLMVTDWDIIGRMHRSRRICATTEEGAKRALRAGNDMIMTTPSFYQDTLDALARGEADMTDVDAAVRNVLRLKFRLGLFENPRLPDIPKAVAIAAEPGQRALALESARKSLVLLKNRRLLPLRTDRVKKLAVIGPNADDWVNTLGDWQLGSGQHHNTRDMYVPENPTVTILQGLQNLLGDAVAIRHGEGCGVPAPGRAAFEGAIGFAHVTPPFGDGVHESAPEKIQRAVRLAEDADVAVLVLGDTIAYTGEMKSTATLDLPGDQQALFDAVVATGTPVVVVLLTGKPLAIPQIAQRADAILQAHSPGMEGGTAIAEALFGHFNPSGRLTVSWPHHVGQCPVRYDQAPGAHHIGYPDLPDAGFNALFPFGFGLSYCPVRYFRLELAKTMLEKGETLEFQIQVNNRGNLPVEETVQCYLQDTYTSAIWPEKKLKAWQRVTLAPGEVRTVRFSLPYADLAFCNDEAEWVVEPGEFEILVGPSSRHKDLQRAAFVAR
jgi:beta-glucosidase